MARALTIVLSLLSAAGAEALQVRAPSSLRLAARPHAAVRLQLSEPPKGGDDEADDEGAALAAAFKARMDEEGGETLFKMKTDATRVGESVQDGASKFASGIKDAGNKLLDVGTSRGSNNGLLDDNSWRATVGFFIALIVISIAGAVFNKPPDGGASYNYGTVDQFTSDGQPLQFGRQ